MNFIVANKLCCALLSYFLALSIHTSKLPSVSKHSLSVLTVHPVIYQLPVVSDLRNPSLKQRHWDAIERVVDYTFTEDEPFTLGLLVQIGAFSHSEQIQEISAQASSEASLEGILKKVLSVIPIF